MDEEDSQPIKKRTINRVRLDEFIGLHEDPEFDSRLAEIDGYLDKLLPLIYASGLYKDRRREWYRERQTPFAYKKRVRVMFLLPEMINLEKEIIVLDDSLS